MALPSTTKRPKLDPGTFGASPAAQILAEKLNEKGDAALARHVMKIIQAFGGGLNEMIKMNTPPRVRTMQWWYEDHLQMAKREVLEKEGMWSFFENVMQTKLKQFLDQGAVLEVLRERDPDYSVITDALRQIRLEQDRG